MIDEVFLSVGGRQSATGGQLGFWWYFIIYLLGENHFGTNYNSMYSLCHSDKEYRVDTEYLMQTIDTEIEIAVFQIRKITRFSRGKVQLGATFHHRVRHVPEDGSLVVEREREFRANYVKLRGKCSR